MIASHHHRLSIPGETGETKASAALSYIFIGGPTASGKSQLAVELAEHLGGDLVNCDSIQLYRGFDIGSAKVGGAKVSEKRVHLTDCLDWDEPFDAAQYAVRAREVIRMVNAKGKVAIVVGGTGLYFKSLSGEAFHQLPSDAALRKRILQRPEASLWPELFEKDPLRAGQIHPQDILRCARALELHALTGKSFASLTSVKPSRDLGGSLPICTIVVDPERASLHQRIALRVDAMLRRGLVHEVESLLAAGCPREAKPMLSIGYKQVVDCLDGSYDREQLAERMTIATRQYAKRQSTWFRKVSADIRLRDPDLEQLLANGLSRYIRGY